MWNHRPGFHSSHACWRYQPPPRGNVGRGTIATMKALIGLLWGLGGAVLGFGLAALGAALFAQWTNMTTREGASGYFMMGMGLIGAIVGLIAGLAWFAQRAPAGEGFGQFGQGVLGLLVFVALVAAALWAWVYTRESPAMYAGQTQANLELEFRLPTDQAPGDAARRWLNVEVTTTGTRPVALVLQDQVRNEAQHLVVPAVQGPLIRAGQRLVVARLTLPDGERHEVFMPRMARQPDPRAGWSDWVAPREVFDVRTGRSGLPPLLQMRWRLRLYGE